MKEQIENLLEELLKDMNVELQETRDKLLILFEDNRIADNEIIIKCKNPAVKQAVMDFLSENAIEDIIQG